MTILLVCILLLGFSEGRIRSNSQSDEVLGLMLADVTGDGVDDWVLTQNKAIFVVRTNFATQSYGYSHAKFPIRRRFHGKGKDLLGVIGNSSQGLYEYKPKDQYTGVMVEVSSQPLFVQEDEAIFVGDFDSDGADEVLLYRPSEGIFNVWKYSATEQRFAATFDTLFRLADLNEFRCLNCSVWIASAFISAGAITSAEPISAEAGVSSSKRNHKYGAQVDGDDILMLDSNKRHLTVFYSKAVNQGATAFIKGFSTRENLFTTTDEISVANIRGGNFDDVVVHSPQTGRVMFYEAKLNRLTKGHILAARFAPETKRRTYVWAYTQRALELDSDPDLDGINTRVELGGLDRNYDGVSDEPLHRFGASPFLVDVFLEVDYMANFQKSLRPSDEVVSLAVRELGAANINLHVVIDDVLPFVENLGGTSFSWEKDFTPIKQAHFTKTRWGIYHYVVFANRHNDSSISGRSKSVPSSEILVTLGAWDGGVGSVLQQGGTLLHELGHNFGLTHGGSDDMNLKPNHLSIMNYLFQTNGLWKNNRRRFLYSEVTCEDLNEGALDESKGIECETPKGDRFRTAIGTSTKWLKLNNKVDFNGDGNMESKVAFDLNQDSRKTILTGSTNEYNQLVFSVLGPRYGEFTRFQHKPLLSVRHKYDNELSYETYKRLKLDREDAPVRYGPHTRSRHLFQSLRERGSRSAVLHQNLGLSMTNILD